MPPTKSLPKSSPVTPNDQQSAARRQRLQRGISALKVALDSLPLAAQQHVLVQSLIREQEQLLNKIDAAKQTNPQPKRALPKQATTPAAKSRKKRLSQEEQKRRSIEGQLKKERRADQEKRIQLIEAKRRAEVEALHRKSGYSSFMRRVPGSFEGGKK